MKTLRFLALVAVVAVTALAYLVVAPFGPRSETFVDIPAGTGTTRIGALLEENGVIRSRYLFDVIRLMKRGRLRAGEYRFDHPTSLLDVYTVIARGEVYTRNLVIPPGYNIFDIASAVQQAGLGSRDAFLAAERSQTTLIATISPGATSLEGFLFPDTYRFSRHVTPETILTAMVKRWQRAALQLKPQAAAWSPYLPAEARVAGVNWTAVVTMASLIEKEVAQAPERPLVAGVFVNRLRDGMPLQTDPAVIYAALLSDHYRGTIYASDLHADSAYNTYRHTGLPPGPICNPGIASLLAALAPAKTDYLYFVSDAAGHSRFASSMEEHNRNVSEYRKLQPH